MSCYSKFYDLLSFFGLYLCSIAMGCIYTEAKNYPREPAAHVAISETLCCHDFTFSIYFFWCCEL